MFNIEKSIAEWRGQMLVAGIKSPVPLEELEIHLREEIERHVEMGQGEAQAFTVAVHNIGKGGPLRNEFNKVKPGHKTLRPIGLITGWLTAGYALVYATIGLEFHWNFFNFHEKWDAKTMFIIGQFSAAEVAFWFLAKTSRDMASRVVSFLICLFMAGFAVCSFLPPEALTQVHSTSTGHSSDPAMSALVSLWVDNALSRHAPSPLWYRGCLTALFFAPGIFRAWWMRLHKIQKRDSIHEGRTAYSS